MGDNRFFFGIILIGTGIMNYADRKNETVFIRLFIVDWSLSGSNRSVKFLNVVCSVLFILSHPNGTILSDSAMILSTC